MSLAVFGKDTGVGKTVASAVILARYGRPGSPIAYWKPVATGGRRGSDSSFIRDRRGGRATVLAEAYLFDPPLTPHLAARRAGVTIRGLRGAWRRHEAGTGGALVVEGVGGVLVPLGEHGGWTLADLAGLRRRQTAVVLVARTALGTINHTRLSLEALEKRHVPVAGVVLDGPPSRENREAIERFGRVRVIAEIPPLAGGRRPSAEAILAAARRFDRAGVLARWLGRA